MTLRKRSTLGDQATRERLLQAAAPLFAQRGFRRVAVRDVCREAHANVAAVNYHFRSKLGLYKEVVRLAAEKMKSAKQDAMQAGEGRPPEDQLRAYIRANLRNLLSQDADSWMHKLIGREMAEPSLAFDVIVEHGIKPDAARLAGLVSRLLGCPPEDERVWQCALSIRAQFLFYASARKVFPRISPGFEFTSQVIDRIAGHIADFSLAGIRQAAFRKPAAKA